MGTPLELDDERLKAHAEWLKKHDVTIVKIDSAERHEAEDVYVSDKVISRVPQPPRAPPTFWSRLRKCIYLII